MTRKQKHDSGKTQNYFVFHLPTTSTKVEIFCPPGNWTVAWIFALPGFKALTRTEMRSVSEYSMPVEIINNEIKR